MAEPLPDAYTAAPRPTCHTQSTVDCLDEEKTVLEFFRLTYPNEGTFKRDEEEWRSYLGRFGVTGRMQTTKIGHLSDGQKSRLVFAMM